MRLDLHVHSCYSNDAVTKPETLVKLAMKKNIGFAITDHNNCNAWRELKKLSKQHHVPVILGEEIKLYEQGALIGEVAGLFMQGPVLVNEYSAAIDKIKQQDALLVVVHPFDLFRKPYFHGFRKLDDIKKKLDAVEVYNSHTRFAAFDKKALKFAESNHIPKTAGSDAHFPEEFGNAFTIVQANDLEGARREIKKGGTEYFGKKAHPWIHIKVPLARMGILKH